MTNDCLYAIAKF